MNLAFPDPGLPWAIAYSAVKLIAHFEQGPKGGCALVAYRCDAGVWTIGWGETDGDKARPGATCTQVQGDRWLCDDIAERALKVKSLLKRPAGPSELGALVSLTYNIGMEAFAGSTVLRAHNAGDSMAAARAFSLWNKARDPATGKLRELAGLTRRRAAEAAMYLEDSPAARGVAQEVAPESRLRDSPLVKLGASLATSGGVVGMTAVPSAPAPATTAPTADVVAQAASAAAAVKEVSGTVTAAASGAREAVGAVAGLLGVTPQVALAIALVVFGGAVIYWRGLQRRKGWA